jgi:hypothetical protein
MDARRPPRPVHDGVHVPLHVGRRRHDARQRLERLGGRGDEAHCDGLVVLHVRIVGRLATTTTTTTTTTSSNTGTATSSSGSSSSSNTTATAATAAAVVALAAVAHHKKRGQHLRAVGRVVENGVLGEEIAVAGRRGKLKHDG